MAYYIFEDDIFEDDGFADDDFTDDDFTEDEDYSIPTIEDELRERGMSWSDFI